MNKDKFISGSTFTVYALVTDGICLAKEFISSLDDRDKTQVFNLIEFISENGPPHNVEKFRKLENGIFEIKTRNNIRIACFFDGEKAIVLTHGFPKLKGRQLRIEIDRAISLYEEYLNTKKQGKKRGKK